MADSDMEMEGFSLADLADIDISGVEEIRFQQLAAGVYTFEITGAALDEDTDKDGLRRFKAEFEVTVREVHAILESDIDRDSMVGKKQTERFFIKPQDTQEDVLKSIGRIRAFLTDTGANSDGKLKEAVENAKGTIFKSQVVKQKDKTDPSVSYARLKLEAKK